MAQFTELQYAECRSQVLQPMETPRVHEEDAPVDGEGPQRADPAAPEEYPHPALAVRVQGALPGGRPPRMVEILCLRAHLIASQSFECYSARTETLCSVERACILFLLTSHGRIVFQPHIPATPPAMTVANVLCSLLAPLHRR